MDVKKSYNWKKQFSGHHVVYSVKAKHISQKGLSLPVMNVIYVNILKLEDTHSRIMQIQFRPRFGHESEYFLCFFTQIGRGWISRFTAVSCRRKDD